MHLRFLGTHNAESSQTRLSSFIIDGILAVDAGSLTSELTLTEQSKIKAILLSHGHYDHIRDVPAFAFNNSDRMTRIFGTAQTLEILSSHLIDGIIYPDFTSANSYVGKVTLELVPLTPEQPLNVEGYEVTAIPVNHPLQAAGLLIAQNGNQVFYTGDTGLGLSAAWDRISPTLIITELTLPNRLEANCTRSGHLCPRFLAQELAEFRKIKGYLPAVKLVHLSPQYEPEIKREVKKSAAELGASISIAHEGERLTV